MLLFLLCCHSYLTRITTTITDTTCYNLYTILTTTIIVSVSLLFELYL